MPEVSAPKVYVLEGLPAPVSVGVRSLALFLDWILGALLLGLFFSTWIIPHWLTNEMQEVALFLKALSENKIVSASAGVVKFSQTLQAFLLLGFWVFFVLSEQLTEGASLGKMIFGLKVLRIDSLTPPGILESMVRSSFKTLNIFILFPLLLVVSLLFLMINRRYTLHDWFCRTIIVYDEEDEDDTPSA